MKFLSQKGILSFIAIFCSAILCFAYLSDYPISMWDEARLANNALEMDLSGNWIVTTFDRIPDYGNVKFPLLIWLQVLSMRCFGFDEFGMRLPIAMAVFALCLYLWWFSIKYLKDFKIGLFAMLVLVTSNGFMDIHGGRTGDYDALLSLFTTISVLTFFNYIQENDRKQLMISCISFVLAVFTKSIAGMLFLLPMFVYIIYKGKVKNLLSSKEFYFGIGLFFAIIGSYVTIRAGLQADYIESIIRVDTIGRAVNAIDGHVHPFGYYWHLFIQFHFAYWVLFLFAGMAYAYFEKSFQYRTIIGYIATLIFMHLMTISLCTSKLQWYSLPNIPLASLVAAIFINEIFKILAAQKSKIFATCFVLAIFILPYFQVFNKINHGQGLTHNASLKKAVDFVKSSRWNQGPLICIEEGYFADMQFYIGAAKRQNKSIKAVSIDYVAKGDKVMFYKKTILEQLQMKWQFRIIEHRDDFYYVELVEKL